MRAVIQRVSSARVSVGGDRVGEIGRGLVVLVGVGREDGPQDVEWLSRKLRALRIFEDDAGKMNLSVRDIGGALLLVSQFTLYGDVRQGSRPGFSDAMAPEPAQALYRLLVERCKDGGLSVEEGRFRASMQLELVNDGPVTLLVDSRRPT
ncbi:MAG: D-aminoacyl-tRNA deacylase [Deltaproteobacteria bacterium]